MIKRKVKLQTKNPNEEGYVEWRWLQGMPVGNCNTILEKINEEGGKHIIVDTEMSDTSTNAVQNKVIKAYIDSFVSYLDDVLTLLISGKGV